MIHKRKTTYSLTSKMQRTKKVIFANNNINLIPLSCTTHLVILMQYTPSNIIYYGQYIYRYIFIMDDTYLSTDLCKFVSCRCYCVKFVR